MINMKQSSPAEGPLSSGVPVSQYSIGLSSSPYHLFQVNGKSSPYCGLLWGMVACFFGPLRFPRSIYSTSAKVGVWDHNIRNVWRPPVASGLHRTGPGHRMASGAPRRHEATFTTWAERLHRSQWPLFSQGNHSGLPQKPVAQYCRLLAMKYGLLLGRVACSFGLVGFPGLLLWGSSREGESKSEA